MNEVKRTSDVKRALEAKGAIENVCSRVIWMEKGRIVMDGDTKEVSAAYRSFTYRMARDREDEAMAILRDAITQAEAQRAASALTLPIDDAPAPADNVPELEPDPFASIFDRQMQPERFPATVAADVHTHDRDSQEPSQARHHRRGRRA